MIGETVSHYRILERIGQGGMGVIFRAEDTSLHREVALKFLPPDSPDETVSQRRLVREARAAAALNHPNICAIHEIGRHGDQSFIVMELVKGRTLKEILGTGPLPIREATVLAQQIADALDAAHGAGLVHRDIKPANVLVTDRGQAKVLDFGLAKSPPPAPDTPTVTRATDDLTAVGAIIGTVPYMSPEQIRGEPLDARSDLFSRGSRDLGAEAGAGPVTAPASAATVWWLGAAAMLVVALLAGSWLWRDREDLPIQQRIVRTDQLTFTPEEEARPVLSPDGNTVLYNTGGEIWSRRVGADRSENMTGGLPGSQGQPAFSPSGDRVAFASDEDGGGIWVMGAGGQDPRRLTDFGRHPSWSPDGTRLVFSTISTWNPMLRPTLGSELWVIDVDVAGAEPRRLFGDVDAVDPTWSPHGHRIAFYGVHTGGWRDVYTIASDGTDLVPVTNDLPVDWGPVWGPEGRYLYWSSARTNVQNVWAVRIDEETGELLTDPEPVTNGGFGDRLAATLSADGTRLVYLERLTTRNILRAPIDPDSGRIVGPAEWVTEGNRIAAFPDPSHDGTRITFANPRHVQEDVFVTAADGSGQIRNLTDSPFRDRGPQWSPADDRILFFSDRGGNYEIWSIRGDGHDLRQVTGAGYTASDPVWSPDGSRIAYNLNVGDRVSTWLLDADVAWDEQIPEELPELGEDGATFSMAPASLGFSPDGGFLHGHDRETSASVLYVMAEKRYITDVPRPLYWVPNGRGRYVSRGDDGLFVHDPRTGTNEPLEGPDVVAPFGEVSPDGRWVFYFVTDVSADLWMVTLR